jgi:hypothetical protein
MNEKDTYISGNLNLKLFFPSQLSISKNNITKKDIRLSVERIP